MAFGSDEATATSMEAAGACRGDLLTAMQFARMCWATDAAIQRNLHKAMRAACLALEESAAAVLAVQDQLLYCGMLAPDDVKRTVKASTPAGRLPDFRHLLK